MDYKNRGRLKQYYHNISLIRKSSVLQKKPTIMNESPEAKLGDRSGERFVGVRSYIKVLFEISACIFCSIIIVKNRSCFEDLQINELPTPSDITERVDLNETRLLKLEVRLGGSVSDVTE